jgi:hypothetical protein
VGTGTITLSSMQNDRGETEYTLATNHTVCLLRRHFVRTMRYVGEDRHESDGVERVFHVLRDVNTSREAAPVAAYVEKAGHPRVYLVYPGIAGEMKAGPEGEAIPV